MPRHLCEYIAHIHPRARTYNIRVYIESLIQSNFNGFCDKVEGNRVYFNKDFIVREGGGELFRIAIFHFLAIYGN